MSASITFHVHPAIRFSCACCGCIQQTVRAGVSHISSSFACQECGAYYIVDWECPVEASRVRMSHGPTHEATAALKAVMA